MGFVEHPGADLALAQGLAQGVAAQLLGHDNEDGDVAQPEPLEHGSALRHGQQPIDRGRAADAARFQAANLIGHQGDQG